MATGAIVSLYWVACILTILLLCRPIQLDWDQNLDGTCGDKRAIEKFSSAFNMVLDLWVVFLPLPMIWDLQLPKGKKWTVTVSFSFGLCTAGVNLARLVYTLRCKDDFAFCTLINNIFIVSEMTSGILVATVPTLGVLRCGRRDTADSKAARPDKGLPSRPRRIKPRTLSSSLFSSQGTNGQARGYETPVFTNGIQMGPGVEGGLGESSTERIRV
ncbi:hypothetical protein PG996_007744 [Apiospora saccharicola]|uniref:Rhodopsin domain-containing protein n=1 Tax=Apiospora saccharicola TaxID=335842 RepID=A0ABR1VCP2_9PEZI